jgi:hypothetical protein
MGSRVLERDDGPQAASLAKFDASGGMAFGSAGQTVHGSAPAQRGAKRAGTPSRHQALAGTVHAPLVVVERASGEHCLHHFDRRTNRALLQRTRADIAEGDAGGQTVRGGTTKLTPSTKGKQEPKQTAGSLARAVAPSQSSSEPMRAMATVTAE